MKTESIDDILVMLIRGLVILENDLGRKILCEKISNDMRTKYLNVLKIFIYLTVEFTNHLEKKQQSSKDNDILNSSNTKVKPVITKSFSNETKKNLKFISSFRKAPKKVLQARKHLKTAKVTGLRQERKF